MSNIRIIKTSIIDLDTDAIVNAANEGLWAGGGVCGAIFHAAGYEQLQAACDKIGHCDTGSAVITPGFKLKAKYIIHAVGPVWSGGKNNEPKLLYGAYMRSLELAVENGCRSIGFPLISAGIFGYPTEEAWCKGIQACCDFLKTGREIEITFAVLNDRILALGNKVLKERFCSETAELTKSETRLDYLMINGQRQDAIFFHLPEEQYGFLSNWYPAPFDMDGKHFTSTEQYIMYQKCAAFGDYASADAVLATDDTAKQQAIGRNAGGYEEKLWAGMRQMVAFRALLAKFSQNPDLKQRLIDTENAWLVECAHSDKTWACGVRLNEEDRHKINSWRGQNLLGFALMEVRSMLRGQQGR